MKKVLVLSDLHLEFSNFNVENKEYDIIVLAGDISQDFSILESFISKLDENKKIIFVPGNHEYEGRRMEEVIPKIKELSKDFKNFQPLQNETVDIEGIRFIGTTLWSNFESSGINNKEEVKKWAKFNVVDFSYIFKKKILPNGERYVPINPEDMEEEFNKAYDFLSYELKNNPTDLTKFVVTHFAPHKNSIHKKYGKDMGSPYWCNDLESLMGFSDYWVHGHTHDSFNYNVEGTQVICNPRGVSKIFNISENVNFDKDFILNINNYENKKETSLMKRKV